MRLSANPSLKADLHLNPPGGHLSGTDRATAYGGWVYFRDLFVRTRGKGYKMKFEAYFADLMNADDLGGPSEGASIPSGTSSSSGSTAAKERGLALKSSTLFEVSRLWTVFFAVRLSRRPASGRGRLKKQEASIFRQRFAFCASTSPLSRKFLTHLLRYQPHVKSFSSTGTFFNCRLSLNFFGRVPVTRSNCFTHIPSTSDCQSSCLCTHIVPPQTPSPK